MVKEKITDEEVIRINFLGIGMAAVVRCVDNSLHWGYVRFFSLWSFFSLSFYYVNGGKYERKLYNKTSKWL